MTLKLWLAFVAASAVLLVTPGPTILTVIGYSVSHGRRARAALIAAVALGDSTALAVSLLGLGAVLQTSAFWFSVVKFVGGLYLLYLGIKLLRAGGADAKTHVPETPDSRWRLFVNTYLVTALNPKGIVFFVAFLPQFIHPGVNAAQQFFPSVIQKFVGKKRHVRFSSFPGCLWHRTAAVLPAGGRYGCKCFGGLHAALAPVQLCTDRIARRSLVHKQRVLLSVLAVSLFSFHAVPPPAMCLQIQGLRCSRLQLHRSAAPRKLNSPPSPERAVCR